MASWLEGSPAILSSGLSHGPSVILSRFLNFSSSTRHSALVLGRPAGAENTGTAFYRHRYISLRISILRDEGAAVIDAADTQLHSICTLLTRVIISRAFPPHPYAPATDDRALHQTDEDVGTKKKWAFVVVGVSVRRRLGFG